MSCFLLFLLFRFLLSSSGARRVSGIQVRAVTASPAPTQTSQPDDNGRTPVFNREKNVGQRDSPDTDANNKEKFNDSVKKQLLSVPMIVMYILLCCCCVTGFVYVYLLRRLRRPIDENDNRMVSDQLMVRLDPTLSEETPFDI